MYSYLLLSYAHDILLSLDYFKSHKIKYESSLYDSQTWYDQNYSFSHPRGISLKITEIMSSYTRKRKQAYKHFPRPLSVTLQNKKLIIFENSKTCIMNLNGCKYLKEKLIKKRFQIIYYGSRMQVVILSNGIMEVAKRRKLEIKKSQKRI